MEIASNVQDGSLPGASLGLDGLHQFIGMVFLSVLIIGMGGFSDKHTKKSSTEKWAGQGLLKIFWHYLGNLKIKILNLL
jgi:hypothetical protein